MGGRVDDAVAGGAVDLTVGSNTALAVGESNAVTFGRGVTVAVGDGKVLVAEGSTLASRSCSCTPRTKATNTVRATRTAAISPFKSDPSPPPTRCGLSTRPNPFCAPELISHPQQHTERPHHRAPAAQSTDLPDHTTAPIRRPVRSPASSIGKTKRNVVPVPSSLSTHRRPPCSSISVFTRASSAPDSPSPSGTWLGRV